MSESPPSQDMALACSQYINLAKDVLLVAGAAHSAIYDLRYRRIFSLDSSDTALARALLQGPAPPPLGTPLEALARFLFAKGLATVDPHRVDRNADLLADRPRVYFDTCWLELSTHCNHSCLHCYNFSGPDTISPLDLPALRDYLRQVADVGSRNLKIVGGEPLVHGTDLPRLFDIAQGVGFHTIAVHTNGTLITSKWLEHFRRCGVQADVTVYGHTRALHDAATSTKGSFDATLRGLTTLAAASIPATINLIVLPHNEPYVDDIRTFFESWFPAYPFAHDYLRPAGRGISLYRKLSLRHLNRYREHEIGFAGIDRRTFVERHYYNPCLKDKILITADGTVMSCIMARQPTGHLQTASLRQVVESEAFSQPRHLPLRLVNTCRDCEFRYACDDCRPIAVGLSGDVYAKPPECSYDPVAGTYGRTQKGARDDR